MAYTEGDGIWRTIRGRRVFLQNSKSLYASMVRSGKFPEMKRPEEHRAGVRDAQETVREFAAQNGDALERERDDSFANSVNHAIMGRGSGKPGELPLSVPVKIGHIDYNDKAQVEAQFQEFIEKYSNAYNEHMRIIAENGDVYEIAGKRLGIFWEDKDGIMHKAKSIHNHPTGVSSYSFSSDHPSHDMRSFFSENGSVMEAFDEKYRYRFEMPEEKKLTGQEWKDAYGRAQYLTEKYLDAKGYTIDDDVTELQQHYRISIACKLLGIEDSYRRWPR